MRSERPLIASVVFLATGLSLIFGYCTGTTSFNAAFPLASSALHLDITTTGPAALGGIACTGIGTDLSLWALLAAIVGQLGPGLVPAIPEKPTGLCPQREFWSTNCRSLWRLRFDRKRYLSLLRTSTRIR